MRFSIQFLSIVLIVCDTTDSSITNFSDLTPNNAYFIKLQFSGGSFLANLYGSGVYFARDANYSRDYSSPDPQGLRYMYYAKVLVGDYTTGNMKMKVRPPKNSDDPNETYDSVVNNVANPTIYVVFHDYDYYAEYLITFK